MYAKPAQRGGNAKTEFYLENTPGLKLFSDLGVSFAGRGIINLGGILYAVCDDSLYKIASDGSSTVLSATITGSGRVSLAKILNQIAIQTKGGSAFYYDKNSNLTQIIPYPFSQQAGVLTAQNQRIIGNMLETGQFFFSDLATTASYTGTNIATAERNDDNLVSLIANYDDLFLFGSETLEVKSPTVVDGDVVYQNIRGAVSNVGIIGEYAVSDTDDGIIFVGSDKSIYNLKGYTPQLISTDAIVDEIEEFSSPQTCEIFSYTQKNHKFSAITFPEDTKTFCYDSVTGLFHERSSYYNNANQAWRARTIVKCYGKTLCADYASGKIFQIDPLTYSEDGEEIRRIVEFGYPSYETRGINLSRLEVIMDTGESSGVSDSDTDPIITLEVSHNNGKTYTVNDTKNAGLAGRHETRVVFQSLGHFPLAPCFRLTVGAKCAWRIIGIDIA